MKHYASILRSYENSIWPILPAKMDAIAAFFAAKSAGLAIDASLIAAVAAERRQAAKPSVQRSVAVLPLVGTICQRAGLIEDFSGGVSTEAIGRQFDALLRDDSVGSIVLDVDSPGGEIYGVPELADKIFNARAAGKPCVAVANSLMASAAYWICSAANEVVVTPSGDVGSIGCLAVHYDRSVANEEEGVKPTYVTYGKYKAEFSPDAPLGGEALAELQRRVDDVGDKFVEAAARNRGTSKAKVKSDFGQGRVMGAAEALAAGLVDRIDTLEATIARLASGAKTKRTGKKAGIERQRLALEKFR